MKNHIDIRRKGFTLIEILVVIAIIAVLAGILLAALAGVQEAARKTQTTTLMQAFGRACDEFALDHGRYPGLLPDSIIDGTTITSTQNALLELMGGARAKSTQSTLTVEDEYDSFADGPNVVEFSIGGGWNLAFDPNRFGEGPWIKGRVYEPYFSPKSNDLEYSAYDSDNPSNFRFPSLVDAWETPIIYLRAVRKNGPIIAPLVANDQELQQYDLPNLNQFVDNALNTNSSLLSLTMQSDANRLAWLTLTLAHPTFWEINTNNATTEFDNGAAWGTTRGRYVLISAGPDTIFLEAANEQIHEPDWVFDEAGDGFVDFLGGGPDQGEITPTTMESFDDVVVHGGA